MFSRIMLFSLMAGFLNAYSQNEKNLSETYITSRFISPTGVEINEVIVPGSPPEIYRSPVCSPSSTAVLIDSVPAYSWSFGCSNTTAAMQAGYFDNHGYPDLYTGISNDGMAPLDNTMWGTVTINGETRNQCPISASMLGLEERQSRGHVDDFWIIYRNYGPDPYLVNNWSRHADEDCTGDFMGTNQSIYWNADGNTRFFMIPDGAPLFDYTGNEPSRRDGCHGLRLYYESAGYEVVENFTQLIQGMYGNSNGFTFQMFREEIDNQRPVMLQLNGHSMLGLGYDSLANIVYLHDTWDYDLHQMPWGGSYAGMAQWGVTVLRLQSENPPPLTSFSVSSTTICAGNSVQFLDQTINNPTNWLWYFEGAVPENSQLQNPVVQYFVPGTYSVSLRTTNEFGYDTDVKHGFITVTLPCYCEASANGSPSIRELRFGNITLLNENSSSSGYIFNNSLQSTVWTGQSLPLLVQSSQPITSISCNAWIDWNADFDFDDEGEPVYLYNPDMEMFTTQIQVPENAAIGSTRLRVRLGEGNSLSPCGNQESGDVRDFLLDIQSGSYSHTAIVKVFPEALLNSDSGTLKKVSAGSNQLFEDEISDLIGIDLLNPVDPSETLSHQENLALTTSGQCSFPINENLSDSYYIKVSHRNSIVICSSVPVLFDTDSITYDFTTSSGSAFGQNQTLLSGYFCLPAGDVNQDGIVDSGDMIGVENQIQLMESGYKPEDVNGDGLVDSGDWIFIENNACSFISVTLPF
ncbi:MAG: hypothetical protein IPH88_17190 [Bacteroidales bacterium]|nr:hypothetical protein [Bacteroidales bacterium]